MKPYAWIEPETGNLCWPDDATPDSYTQAVYTEAQMRQLERERDEWKSGHAHLASEIFNFSARTNEQIAKLLETIKSLA